MYCHVLSCTCMYKYVLGCTDLPDPVQVYRIPDEMRSEQKLVKTTSICQCWYRCLIAWIFLLSTNSHISKVRISLSLCYLDAGLKRFEGKKHWSQNLLTRECQKEDMWVIMNYNLHAGSMKPIRHNIFEQNPCFMKICKGVLYMKLFCDNWSTIHFITQ